MPPFSKSHAKILKEDSLPPLLSQAVHLDICATLAVIIGYFGVRPCARECNARTGQSWGYFDFSDRHLVCVIF